jgi:hypothetical protein
LAQHHVEAKNHSYGPVPETFVADEKVTSVSGPQDEDGFLEAGIEMAASSSRCS